MRRATDAFAVLIALAGFAVSYATQATLASEHGFPGWEAWMWPGIADAAALAMVVRLHQGQVRPGWYTIEAWAVFGIASAVAVAANAIADRSDPLGGAMHGVVPIVVLLVAHVIVHGRPGAAEERSQERSPGDPPPARRAPKLERFRVLQGQRPDHQFTVQELAKALRCSRSYARKLLNRQVA